MTTRLAPDIYAGLSALLGETADPVCWQGHDRRHDGLTPSGRRYCADCALTPRRYGYSARREARPCPRCGQPAPPGYVYCAACRAYARDYAGGGLRGAAC